MARHSSSSSSDQLCSRMTEERRGGREPVGTEAAPVIKKVCNFDIMVSPPEIRMFVCITITNRLAMISKDP